MHTRLKAFFIVYTKEIGAENQIGEGAGQNNCAGHETHENQRKKDEHTYTIE